MAFVERSVELKTIGQHNDGLRAALAFIHRKPDRLGPVREQAAAKAPGVLRYYLERRDPEFKAKMAEVRTSRAL
jgi:hypothetical protein